MEMTPARPKISFPLVRAFSDYHEIDQYRRTLSDFFLGDINSYDLGYHRPTGAYYGLFFIGENPKKEDVETFLKKKAGFSKEFISAMELDWL